VGADATAERLERKVRQAASRRHRAHARLPEESATPASSTSGEPCCEWGAQTCSTRKTVSWATRTDIPRSRDPAAGRVVRGLAAPFARILEATRRPRGWPRRSRGLRKKRRPRRSTREGPRRRTRPQLRGNVPRRRIEQRQRRHTPSLTRTPAGITQPAPHTAPTAATAASP
jgi:hypothetical protein